MNRWTTDARQNGAILRDAINTIAEGLKMLSDDDLGAVVITTGTDQLEELMAAADMVRGMKARGWT
jgi:hypothetical protein